MEEETSPPETVSASAELPLGLADHEVLSLAAASEWSGISRETFRALVQSGRLPAYRGRRPPTPGRSGTRAGWVITECDLCDFLASCQRCRYPGCARPGVTSTGCCSRGHAAFVRMHGKKRPPEVGEKISDARTGVPRGAYPPEHREHIQAGLRSYYDSERSEPQRKQASVRMRRSWEIGEGAAPAAVLTKGHKTRSKMQGRWAARRVGRVKGRERGYSELQAKGVRALRRREPLFGYPRLAQGTDLTVAQVRAILADAEDKT